VTGTLPVNDRKLTIVIPALNEGGKIATTVEEVLALAREILSGFEIILVNDGSTDETGAIMDRLAKQDARIRVMHHAQPQGVGRSFASVLHAAKFPAITLIPGDNAFQADGISRLFSAAGSADVVISYRDNQHNRSVLRAILSMTLRSLINILFGLQLRDVHSMIIYPVAALRALNLKADGYAYQIEAVILLLKSGLSFTEVPVSLHAETRGSSRVMRLRTLVQLGQTILKLLFRVQRLPGRVSKSEIRTSA